MVSSVLQKSEVALPSFFYFIVLLEVFVFVCYFICFNRNQLI